MNEARPRRISRTSRALLAGLLLIVLVTAATLWLPHRERELVIGEIERSGGHVGGDYDGPAWLGRLLRGGQGQSGRTPSSRLFQTVRRVVLSGPGVGDSDVAHVPQLAKCRWVQLKEIQLYRTPSVADAGIAHLAGLANVERLWLGGTSITDEGLKYLSGLKQLKFLDLEGTRITGTGLKHLRGLENLEALRLGDTDIDDDALIHLQDLRNLEHLFLFNRECKSRISDSGLEKLSSLAGLKGLYLFGTSVGDGGLEHIKALTGLEILALNYTDVTDEGLKGLTALRSLKALDLEGTAVTDAGMQYLKAMKGLEQLSLDGTPVTDEAVAELRRELPMCQIRKLAGSGRPGCKRRVP